MESTSNASIVNAAAAEATKEAPKQAPTITMPPKTEVTIPGGYISQDGSVVKYAEVRELNGADEEEMSRAKSLSNVLNTILKLGLVSVGETKATKDVLDGLLSGDREAILLGIRKATFGTTAEYNLVCNKCEENSVVVIDLDTDIPVKELDDPKSDREWVVDINGGTAVLTLPNGRTQTRLLEASDKTKAEINTILLEDCVIGINGKSSMGRSTALKLGMLDRERLVDEIMNKIPGPRFGEVTKTCEACGEVNNTPISLVALFRL